MFAPNVKLLRYFRDFFALAARSALGRAVGVAALQASASRNYPAAGVCGITLARIASNCGATGPISRPAMPAIVGSLDMPDPPADAAGAAPQLVAGTTVAPAGFIALIALTGAAVAQL